MSIVKNPTINIFRSGILVFICTLLSRISGLIRDLFIAYLFGSTAAADRLNVALRLPNLFRRIVAEGALSSAFIPIFNQEAQFSKKRAEDFSRQVLMIMILSLSALVIVLELLMPQILALIAPGIKLSANKYDFAELIFLCRITILSLIFLSINALGSGILGSLGNFVLIALLPIVPNLSIIFFTLATNKYLLPGQAIAYSIILSSLIQVCLLEYALRRNSYNILTIFYNINHLKELFSTTINKTTLIRKELKLFLSNFLPAAAGASVMQINLFISQSIATFIPGMVSLMAYADRVYQLPLSLIGNTISTVLLPKLSRIYASDVQSKTPVSSIELEIIRLALILSIPCAIGLAIFANPIVQCIYVRGAFLESDRDKTAILIAIFSLGLPIFILNKVITTIFYAKGDAKTPMKITIYTILLNFLSNIIFTILYGYIGIAVATVGSSLWNVWILLKKLDSIHMVNIGKPKDYTNIAMIGIIFSLINWLIYYFTYLSGYVKLEKFGLKLLALSACIVISILCYVVLILKSGLFSKHKFQDLLTK